MVEQSFEADPKREEDASSSVFEVAFAVESLLCVDDGVRYKGVG